MSNNIVGVADYSVLLDPSLWAQCMLTKSVQPPPLCPLEFAEQALFF